MGVAPDRGVWEQSKTGPTVGVSQSKSIAKAACIALLVSLRALVVVHGFECLC